MEQLAQAAAQRAFESHYAAHLPRLQAKGNAYHVWTDAAATKFTLVVTVHGVTVARRLLPDTGRVVGYDGQVVPPALLIAELLLGHYLTPAVRRWGPWVGGVLGFILFFTYFFFA